MPAATAAPHARSPLKRATTTPLYARQSAGTSADIASPQEAHCSAPGPSVKHGSSPQQQQQQQHGPTLPPADLQPLQSALSRLSSQHHLSDYNRMKRLTATSQPMASASSLPPPALRTNTWASTGHSQSLSTVALPLRASEAPFMSANQATAGYTAAALPPSLSAATYPNAGSILDSSKSNLDPPPAPSLHRTYTEEEGQNPHLHLGTSRESFSSVALSTPALSMDSMPPSPPTSTSQRGNLHRSSGGYSTSSALATPPDHGSPRSVSEARSSPIAKKTNFDEKNDHELSERLLDAMDHSVVQVSGIPIPSRSNSGVLSGDTARIRQIQQQRASAQESQYQRASQQSSKYNSVPVTSQRSAPGLPLPRSHEGAGQPTIRAGSFQYSTSVMRSSSAAMSGLPLSSSSAATSMSTSHSMVTQSSTSSDMSRASTSLTSAHGSVMSSYGAGMASSLSAIVHASRHDTYADGKMQGEDSLYHVHVNHPGLAGVKTSLTHPMNVSPLIPPELLPLYGQSILHAVPTPPEAGHQQHAYQQRARSPLGKLTMHDMPPGSNLNNTIARPPSPTKSSSGSSAMNISRPTTPAAEGKSASTEYQPEEMRKPFVIQPSADIHSLTGPNASAALFSLTLPISQHLAMSSIGDDDDDDILEFTPMMPIKIGNLVLSSCPGKKVRLSDQHLSILGIPEICRPGTGPTVDSPLVDPRSLPKSAIIQLGLNRSPICRDLEMDFKRAMSQADVKCVVCCIDDDELRFLGAAWEEYERVAGKLGLEIIRLPMAEGFAPPSPEVLDAHLSSLITKYTLQGKNCLVHCRGGVGRAGLFACSWMIKLGLLGQVVNIHDPSNKTLDRELRIVEKVIAVIRKRRSAKAIETPQQVQFILQYTHWLASTGRHVTARQVLQEAALA